MDMEQTWAEKRHLEQENNQLKATIGQLKTILHSPDTRDSTVQVKQEVMSKGSSLKTACRTKPSRRDLPRPEPRFERRPSSPIDFKSFLQSSVMVRDTDEAAEHPSSQTDATQRVAAEPRMLGEIVFQLDRRILSHVFQAHKRLYGFTLLNIPEKIIEVSTHPLTGIVDEGYQFHLMQRYAELLSKLSQLGYKTALHSHFCEFIINSYGILKKKQSENSAQETEYNDPSFLRRLIVNTAPKQLQKDLILVLDCLCYMAEQDGKPLLLW